MGAPSKNRRNLAVIGAGVGVAAASVITLLVLRDKPEDDGRRPDLADSVKAPDLSGKPVEGGVVKPWETKRLTPQEEKELAAAEAAEKAARLAEEKAATAALAAAQRADALEQARNAGIIGSRALVQGGSFASLTGTGDISSGFDDDNIYGGLVGPDPDDPNKGGFGRNGYGLGGGMGTIGTGRGTGGGYGVGSGRGGMRGTAVPTVSLGQPGVQGDLDKAIIRRYIKRDIQKIRYCYEKELIADPRLAGVITVKFTISATGTVDAAGATGVNAAASSCIAEVVKRIMFPKPKTGGSVNVTYPFTFRPAGP